LSTSQLRFGSPEEFSFSDGLFRIAGSSLALYPIDRALERINLALTFNKARKAEKGLNMARERLLEAKKMEKLKLEKTKQKIK